LALAALPGAFVAAGAAKSSGQPSVVRVSVTSQAYDFRRPWTKKAPYSMRALGAVLPNKRVLVTAEFVANRTYLELEKPESGDKTAARVECVDYQANLALLKASDEKFLAEFKPLELTSASGGDHLTVLQLEPNGAPVTTEGVMTTVAVTRMPNDDLALLTYRVTVALQFYDASITMPVLKNRKLVGMMVRYDRRTQNADVIPAPVIEHFLKAAAKPPYRGFPRAGFSASATRDPQLRRYARLNPEPPAGVYITDVVKNSPADEAGLKVGDVLAAIDNHIVDQDGNYSDPTYGRIPFSHLLSTRHYDGDTVKFKILRLGQLDTLNVTLRQRSAEASVIAPYSFDTPPRYHVLGGLVFLELSRQYLREWGDDWVHKAPRRFVYYDRYQTELFPGQDRKIVILSEVLASPCTIGYEELQGQIVTRINGMAIQSLAGLAAAVQKPLAGFHKIEFQDEPREIHLDAKDVVAKEAWLMKSYGLPALKR